MTGEKEAQQLNDVLEALARIGCSLFQLDDREKPLVERPNLLWETDIKAIHDYLDSLPGVLDGMKKDLDGSEGDTPGGHCFVTGYNLAIEAVKEKLL